MRRPDGQPVREPFDSDASGPARVVLGVSGGIAAYKACDLLRRLTESGHDVTVVPTPAALRFVGSVTWEALSGKPVSSDVFADVSTVRHVALGQSADLVVVAPATADLLARAASGRADDLLTSTLLAARCPVMFAPAMHTEMWQHPATQANVATLRARGCRVLEPASGRLTGADSGPGRLPEPSQIFEAAVHVLCNARQGAADDLRGRRVVVSAGGTQERLDPVRFLSNHSSGKQGYALAAAAASRGAEVDLVSANVSLLPPLGVTVVDVVSTVELGEAVHKLAEGADAVVMAAAPADFRPSAPSEYKIKKRPDGGAAPLKLVQNPDILAGLGHAAPRDPNRVLVGFAAETGDDRSSILEAAREKLARKKCDLLVVNDVSGGAVFGSDDNAAVILTSDGSSRHVAQGPKSALAHAIWDAVYEQWRDRQG